MTQSQAGGPTGVAPGSYARRRGFNSHLRLSLLVFRNSPRIYQSEVFMGAVATAVAQLDTDNTALTADQAQLVKDQQAVVTDQGNITTAQGAITTDDTAVVAALQALQVAGQPPVSVYFPADANGMQKVVSLTPKNPDGSPPPPPGFTVGTQVPA